jgi:hypothetical protein
VFGVPGPVGGLELSAAKALQQTVSLPINFTSLSSLADVCVEQKATRVKDLPESEKAKYLAEVFKDRDTIRVKLNELIASYSEERCRRMA